MLGNRQNTIAFRRAGENEYGELRRSGNDELDECAKHMHFQTAVSETTRSSY